MYNLVLVITITDLSYRVPPLPHMMLFSLLLPNISSVLTLSQTGQRWKLSPLCRLVVLHWLLLQYVKANLMDSY